LAQGVDVTILTASEARANLYRLIDQTAAGHEPIYITGKRSSAVLVAEEDWRAIQETMYLLAVPGMREAIKGSMAEPLDQSGQELDW
jgi:prevent-host-death family protein